VTSPILYLHGFASGPLSSKGAYFERRFAELGVPVDLPDLSGGDFEHLTLTSQLAVIGRRARELKPRAVIGSSLGGYLAALYAARNPDAFPALVLLAPGFGFARRWPQSLGEDVLRAWRERGWMEVYHYGLKRPCRLDFRLVEDGANYEDYPDVREPVLIVHGSRDGVVNPLWSQEFAAGRPNVTVRLVNSDHQMLDVLDLIWEIVKKFLEDHHLLP